MDNGRWECAGYGAEQSFWLLRSIQVHIAAILHCYKSIYMRNTDVKEAKYIFVYLFLFFFCKENNYISIYI